MNCKFRQYAIRQPLSKKPKPEPPKPHGVPFEARTLGIVQSLTDSPEQVLARQRDALLAEAQALGAGNGSITKWYELQTQAIQDQATAQQVGTSGEAVHAAARCF